MQIIGRIRALRLRLRSLWGVQSGQALLELSLSVPFLIVLLVGASEFGRIAYAGIEVSNAAKAAAQYGASSTACASDTTGMLTAAKGETTDFSAASAIAFSSGYPKLSYICSDGSAATGLSTDCSSSQLEEIVSIQLQTAMNPLIHLPGFPKKYTLYGNATQKVLNQ